ncbi:MAG TPA: hypothetical protein VM285_00040 [Polyangia bacterium]|nr:hypothetical protein [Polyangia bacterium]
MRKYKPQSGSATRVAYGIEVAEGLRFFPETADLAAPFAALNTQLETIYLERKAKERALIPIRAKVRFANFAFDAAVRGAAKTAEIADNGKKGALYKALFPEGLGTVVLPSGEGQAKAGRKFVELLTQSKAPGADAVRDQWLGKLTDAQGGLEESLGARTAAYADVAKTRAVEDAAKEDHELAVERVMGQLRSIFPRDKARWDVVFPSVQARSSSGDEEVEVGEDEAAK